MVIKIIIMVILISLLWWWFLNTGQTKILEDTNWEKSRVKKSREESKRQKQIKWNLCNVLGFFFSWKQFLQIKHSTKWNKTSRVFSVLCKYIFSYMIKG